MKLSVYCRIDATAAHGATVRHFAHPIRVLSATDLSDVAAVLCEVEAQALLGFVAVGFVAYDAAPAFDPALPVHHAATDADGVPLAWFAIFDGEEGARREPGVRATTVTNESWRCDIEPAQHRMAVEQVREAISAGTTYLTNITTRFRRAWSKNDDALALYHQLRNNYSGGTHVFIETDDWAVVCASPERFFTLRGSEIIVQPMKGTAARGRASEEDALVARALRHSEKEQSENVMVVDLFRNDLGRIATPGSVDVPALCELERHRTMWQMTSTVTARVAPEFGFVDVFGSLFPSASVTGAPKNATMKLISELEATPRGLYCGAVGYVQSILGDDGRSIVDAQFSVAIRTAFLDKQLGEATYGVGGGITWDSSPEAEWAELLLKADALRGSESTQPVRALFETMRCHGTEAEGEEEIIANLDGHVARLVDSARYFDFVLPYDLTAQLVEYASAVGRCRLRLTLTRDGQIAIAHSPLPLPATQPITLCIDNIPVDSRDLLLLHKTTNRDTYEARSARHPHADDVVLVNERGEITETTRANIAVLIDDQWWTPPVASGLLPGVERRRLLTEGRVHERVLTVNDLVTSDAVAIFNSLRGWQEATLGVCPDVAVRLSNG